MILGLERGTVRLTPHQTAWEKNAQDTIELLKGVLGPALLDIQHVGSTAVRSIHAKPIIDIAVGAGTLDDIVLYIKALEQRNIIYRGQDIPGQLLFVMGDFARDTRTHHIHVVKWNSLAWNHYIFFRDYLNAFPEKAKLYDICKQSLACQFPTDRERYTAGKQELIGTLLKEAQLWRVNG